MSYFPLIFYFIARVTNFGALNIEFLLKRIIYWFLIVAIIGLVLYYFAPNIENMMILRTGGLVNYYYIQRMGSIFWTPVIFGSFMSFSAIFYYYQLLKKESLQNYVIFALFWGCLFLSVSRGANVSFIIGIILITIFYKKYSILLKTFLVMNIVVFLLWLPQKGNNIYKAQLYIFTSTNNILHLQEGNTRVALWKESYKGFTNHPNGYGLGKAGHVAARFFGHSSDKASTFSTDGWYLKLLNETGIWGLLSYVIVFIIYLKQSFKYLKYQKYSIFNYIFIVFIMVGIQNIVSNVNDFYLFSLLYWLLIGFSQNIFIAYKSNE